MPEEGGRCAWGTGHMEATFHHTNANKAAFDTGNPLDLKKLLKNRE